MPFRRFLAALFLVACAVAPAADGASISHGKQLYSTWCAQCHSANPKNDSKGVLFGANYPPGIQMAIDGYVPDMTILQGIITPADVDDVAAYLGSLDNAQPPPGTGVLSVPGTLGLADQQVGTQGAPTGITIRNTGNAPVAISSVSNNNLAEFPLTTNTCTGSLAAGATCSLAVAFHPAAVGARGGTITIASSGTGSPQSIVVSGTGTDAAPPPPATTTVVEYYWAARDHYFITASPTEIPALDAMQNGANTWVRTGQTFKALSVAAADSSSVCRFYLPAQFGDSHFYGRSPAECALTHTAYPGFVYESPLVMYEYALTPTGGCTAGTIPIYRVFDQRADTNHRYMTSRTLRDQMVARGWAAEGDGPDLIVMCAPP